MGPRLGTLGSATLIERVPQYARVGGGGARSAPAHSCVPPSPRGALDPRAMGTSRNNCSQNAENVGWYDVCDASDAEVARMRRSVWVVPNFVITSLVVLTGACGGVPPSEPTAQHCTPDEEGACGCPDGTQSVKQCN